MLEFLVVDWQNRLRLQDWDISVAWANHYDTDAFGQCRTSLSNRIATIKITRPEQISHESICDDIEVTLVHELLHVKAAEALETDARLGAIGELAPWECFIEQLAQALVAAKRGLARIR